MVRPQSRGYKDFKKIDYHLRNAELDLEFLVRCRHDVI